MSFARLGVTLLASAAVALGALAAASGQMRARGTDGGTLTVGLVAEPQGLDPATSRNTTASEVELAICEKLYDTDANTAVVPMLAAGLPTVSKDKLTYTIPLRHGVVFNDGTPFNAAAVVASIEREITVPNGPRVSDFSSVASVTASGPYTVVFHLKERFTPLTSILATTDGSIVSPTQAAKLGANFTSDPVCVGPFMFDHYDAGADITVVKSPYYYNRGAVHLDRIVFRFQPNAAAAAASLEAGDFQAFDNLSPTVASGLKGLEVVHRPNFGWKDVTINIGNKNGAGNPPYTNVGTPLARSPLLRQAFEEAIDRNALVRVVFGGAATPGCTPVSPELPVYDPTVKCTPYDPPQARKLVTAAGYRNPTIDLMTSDDTTNEHLAEFVQAEEAAVGINVVIDPTTQANSLARAAAGQFDAYLGGFGGCCDPDRPVFQYLASSGSRNYAGYSSPRMDDVLANSRKAATTKALKTLYRTVDAIVEQDRPMIFLYHPIQYAVWSTGVTGVQFRADTLLRVAFAQLK